MKTILVFVIGLLTIAVFVWLNPNPNRRQYAVAEVMPIECVRAQLHITKIGEWNAAFPGRPDVRWGSHVTQRAPRHFIKTGIDNDTDAALVIRQIEEKQRAGDVP